MTDSPTAPARQNFAALCERIENLENLTRALLTDPAVAQTPSVRAPMAEAIQALAHAYTVAALLTRQGTL